MSDLDLAIANSRIYRDDSDKAIDSIIFALKEQGMFTALIPPKTIYVNQAELRKNERKARIRGNLEDALFGILLIIAGVVFLYSILMSV